jgi:hypothetical protein
MNSDLELRQHGHSHPTRRDFFARPLGGALAGGALLELAFQRAAWARALAPTAGAKLFNISKAADGVYFAEARLQTVINASSVIFDNSRTCWWWTPSPSHPPLRL